MRHGWDAYERAANKGQVSLVVKLISAWVVLLVAALFVVGKACSVANEATTVAQEQFGARALLNKYEWFKDASAQLDKKKADIQVYDSRFKSLAESYSGQPRSKWAREDREQYNIWASELSGVRASYNDLAAQYNAEMSKFNWRFANRGELPQGATEPLPREYKPYTEGESK